jgi:hypothetical protein
MRRPDSSNRYRHRNACLIKYRYSSQPAGLLLVIAEFHTFDGQVNRDGYFIRNVGSPSSIHVLRMSVSANDGQGTQLANQLADLKTDLQRVEAQINSQSPRYAMLMQPRPLSLAEIRRQVLDNDTLLLEYSLGDRHSYLWAVTTASLETYELPNRVVITEAARRIYGLLTARKLHPKFETPEERQSRVKRADAEYQTAAAELSQMVLGPVAVQLGNKRLLIVADGWLQYVPFSALPEPATERQRDGGTAREKANRPIAATPLMVNHEITNLPSASTLAIMRREFAGRQLPPKTIVVLGDPVFDKNDERVKVSLAVNRVPN